MLSLASILIPNHLLILSVSHALLGSSTGSSTRLHLVPKSLWRLCTVTCMVPCVESEIQSLLCGMCHLCHQHVTLLHNHLVIAPGHSFALHVYKDTSSVPPLQRIP